MGQNSSQLESTQANDALSTEEVGRETLATLSEDLDKMEPSPGAKRHARSPGSNDEEPHLTKKPKTSHEYVQKRKPTVGRSVPQHRRGTAIMPRHDAAQDRSQLKVQAGNPHALPRPQSSSSSEGEFFDASSIVLSGTPKNGEKPERADGDQEVTKSSKHVEEQDDIEANDHDDEGNTEIEDSFVSAVGRPGPHRPKRTKKKQRPAEDLPNVDRLIDNNTLQDVPAVATEEGAASSEAPAAKSAPRKKKANKTLTKAQKQQPGNVAPGSEATVAPPASLQPQKTRKTSQPSNESQKELDAKTREREEAAKYAILTQRVKDLQSNPEFEWRSGEMLRLHQSFQGDPVKQAAVQEKFFIEWGISLKHIVLPKDWDETGQEQNSGAVDQQEIVQNSQPTEQIQAESTPNGMPRDSTMGAASKSAKKKRKAAGTGGHSKKNVSANNKPVTQPASNAQPIIAQSPPSALALPADRIPTPPTSLEQPNQENNNVVQTAPDNNDILPDDADDHEPNYDARDREGYVDPGNKISTWLDHEETPVPPDDVGPSRGSPEQVKHNPPPKTKKRAGIQRDDGNDEYHDERDSGSDVESQDDAPKVKKREQSNPVHSKTRKQSPATDDQRGTLTGPWSNEEKTLADSIFDTYLDNLGRTEWTEFQLRNAFIDWKDTVPEEFKETFHRAFPLRSKKAIREFCKRRFHQWKTGAWTEEDDRKLEEAYVLHNGSWGWIGDDLERTAQACRDRWTSKVQFDAKVEKGPWTTHEEENLLEVVESLLERMKTAARDRGEEDYNAISEKSIKWADVSKMLEKLRNPKQCRDKYKALKSRAENGLETTLASMTANPMTKGRKQRDVDRAYSKLGWADVYDALQEIITATESTSSLATEFPLESTFWAIVATKLPDRDLKFPSRLRRRCYYGATEKFGDELLEDISGFGYRAVVLADALVKAKEKGEIEWKRTMEGRTKKKAVAEPALETSAPAAANASGARPAVVGRNEPMQTHRAPANPTARPPSRNKYLSEEFIEDSDDESEPDAANDNEDAVAGGEREEDVEEELVDEFPISSLNSRYDDSLHHSTPALKPRDFIQRCQGLTRALHRRLETVQEGSS